MFRPIVGYAFLALDWRRDPGKSRVDPEFSDDDDDEPVGHCGTVTVEQPYCEGQNDVVTAEEAEGSDRESDGELAGCETDEEEEFESENFRVKTTDEFYCCYDSTWETEENYDGIVKRPSRPAASSYHYKFRRFENAARDMHNYRHDYPSQIRLQSWKRPVSDDKPNLKFYLGQKPSIPDGVYIDSFHDEWFGDYDALEYIHTYIQWLFPLQEPGMNNEASPLTKEEIKAFLNNSTAKENLLKSYKLMLDFYGIQLCNEETGEVKRSPNWRNRFNNLNTHTHNNLRITRILKCQGTLGYPHYQAPLVHFFLEETLVNGELPNVKDSVLNYFVFAVLDKKQRRSLIKFAYLNYDRKDEFVWCPKKIQQEWSRLSESQEGTRDYLSLDNKDEAKALAN